jgi:lipocalin
MFSQERFDLDVYMYAGKWYEIARKPNQWQNPTTCARSTLNYYVDDSDLNNIALDVESNCFTETGKFTETSKARATFDGSNILQVKWEGAPSYNPLIIYDTDYNEYSIEGMEEDDGKMNYWILSRTPTMCNYKINQLLDKMEMLGLDTSKLEISPQAYRLCEKRPYGRMIVR